MNNSMFTRVELCRRLRDDAWFRSIYGSNTSESLMEKSTRTVLRFFLKNKIKDNEKQNLLNLIQLYYINSIDIRLYYKNLNKVLGIPVDFWDEI